MEQIKDYDKLSTELSKVQNWLLHSGLSITDKNNENLGGNFEFVLSYYLPIKAVDLSLNISYEQFVDIKEDLSLDFGSQGLIGINFTLSKSLIIN